MKMFVMVSQLGTSVILPILVCVFAGVWIDNRFGTELTVVFIILGVLAGVRNAWVMLQKIVKDMKEESDEKENWYWVYYSHCNNRSSYYKYGIK